MSRGAWMVKRRRTRAGLAAETASGAIAVRLAQPSRQPVDGVLRRIVAYCNPDVEAAELAAELRALADLIEENDA